MKKITRATIKSFVKKNRDNLLINVHSDFNGMIDGLDFFDDGFIPAKHTDRDLEYTMGVEGAYLVPMSRNWFYHYEENGLVGITASNSCGSFTVAIRS